MRLAVVAMALGPLLVQAAPAATPAQAQSQVARKDTLVIPNNVNIPAPDIWNPYIPDTFILQGMNQNLMEPLFMLNYQTGQIEGWLAESYTNSPDQTQWTVKLRPGTEWSDGQPLTSDDIVFTIQMLQQYAPQLNWSGAMKQWVQSVQAIDDRTVQFNLTGPNPRFVLENLAGTTSQAIVPVPKHLWQGQDPTTFKYSWNNGQGAVFSGPYVVDQFSSTEFDYKRNDNWWGAKSGAFPLPAPLEIKRPWVADNSAQAQMLVNNDADFYGPQTSSELAALQAQNGNLKSYGDQGWTDPCPRMFTLNTTVAPWNSKEMRHALSYAIDRQQIVNVVYEGVGETSNFIFPTYPAMQPYIDAGKPILDAAGVGVFDLDKSKELFQGQGYTMGGDGKWVGPDGKTLSIDIIGPPFMEPWGRMVVQQLQTAGVDANLRLIEWGVFRDQTGRGNFTGAVDWDGCGSTVEPWFGMNRYNKSWVQPIGTAGTEYVDNTSNAGRWSNDQYSALMDQMGQYPIGDPRVMDVYQQALTVWADELPDIPLVQTPTLYLFNQTYWTNWPTADNAYIQPPAHWEQFLKQLINLKPAQQ
jgi:peptide/nickel transport system substrate-binding protein